MGTGIAPARSIPVYETKNAREVGSIKATRPPAGPPRRASSAQPRKQFPAFQAAESQVAVELRGWVKHGQRALAAQLIQQTTNHVQHAFAHGRAVKLSDRGSHGTHEAVRLLQREAITPNPALLSTRRQIMFQVSGAFFRHLRHQVAPREQSGGK